MHERATRRGGVRVRGGEKARQRKAEIGGGGGETARTRYSLWPSSIRIPRISVNGPLLPRPFG